jgi:precorrin-6x reductase
MMVVIFGGTTEGRRIAERCAEMGAQALYSVATTTGALPLSGVTAATVATRIGALDAAGIRALLSEQQPALVVDATHPYATAVSQNIAEACNATNTPRIAIRRDDSAINGCTRFKTPAALVAYLNETPGRIFVATGAKEAAIFTGVRDFAERVYFRLLPSIEGLRACLDLGYKQSHLMLLWGPFSAELNRALFRQTGASILVTKDSGASGGFAEKVDAALALKMNVALLERPPADNTAITINEALVYITTLLTNNKTEPTNEHPNNY